MILEVSQYLENYLWPNFDPDAASFEHVMSMILMVNEKIVEDHLAFNQIIPLRQIVRLLYSSLYTQRSSLFFVRSSLRCSSCLS
uniref:RNA helicase aquarius N-terminal domain-containing protein n=1 Tax=Quercus lobata TaxID=97700 RepID=A0A7N2KPZ4_QUELO